MRRRTRRSSSDNLIYSNNFNIFSDDRDEYCKQPPEQRDPTVVCPTFQVPVGTGMLIAGGNDNIVQNNYIYDNWRRGTMLHWVPASLRDEPDPAKGSDTSNNNAYVNNCMGIRPASVWSANYTTCQGYRDANGVDFWWDEEEGTDCDPASPGCVDTETQKGNCWIGNAGPNGSTPTADPPFSTLPICPGLDNGFKFPNIDKLLELLPCAEWNPRTNTDPPGLQLVRDAARAPMSRVTIFPAPRVNPHSATRPPRPAGCASGNDHRGIRGES